MKDTEMMFAMAEDLREELCSLRSLVNLTDEIDARFDLRDTAELSGTDGMENAIKLIKTLVDQIAVDMDALIREMNFVTGETAGQSEQST